MRTIAILVLILLCASGAAFRFSHSPSGARILQQADSPGYSNPFEGAHAVAVSPDGKWFAAGEESGAGRVNPRRLPGASQQDGR